MPGRRALLSRPASTLLVGLTAAVVIAAGAALAVGGRSHQTSCTVPGLAGTVVDVTAMDMGHGMMGGRMAATMRLWAAPTVVPAGIVSLRVFNAGNRTHEVVVLPLAESDQAGFRAVGTDDQVDETGSLGEVSRSCGEGSGAGIKAGATGWVTLTLDPGRYELLCNEPGHYAAGMWTELRVG